MKIFLKYCIILVLSAGVYNIAFAQNTSNKGKDFWLGYGNHVGNQSMVLYVTSDVNTTVTVEIKGILNSSYPVTANSIKIIDIPVAAFLGTDSLSDKGIHITAAKPVVVYAHIFARNVSGATLVLPTNTLGKEYYSINYTQISNQEDSYSYFFIVAVEDNTEVEIIPAADTQNGMVAGKTYRKKLSKGQIYQVLGKNTGSRIIRSGPNGAANFYGTDLTGSKIRSISTTSESCKRIAVFSGSGKIGIGCATEYIGSSDNLYQQVYPTVSWGRKYITVPLASRNYDVYRIVKSSPSAVVKLNNTVIPAINFVNGFYYEFSSQTVNVIESDQPVQVVQYAVTQNKEINCGNYSETVGDPEMIYLNSIEQNIENITLYSTGEFIILNHYINVVIPTTAVSSFTLDGRVQGSYFTPVPGNPEYSFARLEVTEGVHTLAAAAGFNAIAYGFGSAESYGYSAGTNVKGLDIEVKSKVTEKTVSSGCVNEPLRFSVSLAFQTGKITWDLGNGATALTTTHTAPDATENVNGKTFYVYELPQDVSYTTAKDYQIEITVEKGDANDCGATEIIPFEFTVYDPQLPEFSATTACAGEETVFRDLSEARGRPITKWTWDFGDNTTSAAQNPGHTYAQGGTYKVSLTITNEGGCDPVVITHDVTVIKRPVVDFIVSGNCEKGLIVFTDQSASETSPIGKWRWDFGDGTTLTASSASPITHVYDTLGTYQVKLFLETQTGCLSDTLTKTLVVHPIPATDFVLPEVCLADAFAEFNSTTTISDHSESAFNYSWDFGDANATGGNPNISTLKSPRHKYTATGIYTATLTVTSNNGCSVTKTKTFKVNGSVPKAAFEVANSNSLCSNLPVAFINRSTVDFGDITRLEWYFDFQNDPLSKVVDDLPEPGKVYLHKYPELNDASALKEYRVKLVVYSGTSCVNELVADINLKPVPDVSFTLAEFVCIEDNAFQIAAKGSKEFAGSGLFKGDGISSTGIFDPVKAGPGTHVIEYIFTPVNGCSDTASNTIIVYPSPTVNAGGERYLLAGGELNLSVKTQGNIASYKWSPATGLSRTDIPDPVTTIQTDIIYTVTVTTDLGCTATDNLKITVLEKPEIPNTFTPNNDGINDVWNIKHLETYPSCIVEIFTRYGSRVFTSLGYGVPWDGKSQGLDLPIGTYYYVIRPKNGQKEFSGSITIIR